MMIIALLKSCDSTILSNRVINLIHNGFYSTSLTLGTVFIQHSNDAEKL